MQGPIVAIAAKMPEVILTEYGLLTRQGSCTIKRSIHQLQVQMAEVPLHTAELLSFVELQKPVNRQNGIHFAHAITLLIAHAQITL